VERERDDAGDLEDRVAAFDNDGKEVTK